MPECYWALGVTASPASIPVLPWSWFEGWVLDVSVPPPSLYSCVLGVTSSPTSTLVLLRPWCACPTSILVLPHLWFEGSKVAIMWQWLGSKFRLLLLGNGQLVLFDSDGCDFLGFCSPLLCQDMQSCLWLALRVSNERMPMLFHTTFFSF